MLIVKKLCSNIMENREFYKGSIEVDVNVSSCDDRPVQNGGVIGSGNLDVLLEDLDSYMQDVNDRLTISRMVSDSVIKGIVNAVEQQAAEKMSAHELEIAGLREMLNFYHNGGSDGLLRSREACSESKSLIAWMNGSSNYKREEFFSNLREEVKHQFTEMKKEIDKIRAYSSVRKNKSSFQMDGLGGVLDENASEKWMDVDKMLDCLRNTVDSGYQQMDVTVYAHQTLLRQGQQEREFEMEIEDMVIRNCIRSFQEDFEENLWRKHSRFFNEESINWTGKMKEISNLREELDSLSKSLLVPDNGKPMSPEIGDERNSNKRPDNVLFKVSGHPISSSTSLWEGNGKHESVIPGNLDLAQLNHMTKDELATYFKIEMIKMKRNHESKEQLMTEEYFSLKREFLNFRERGSAMSSRKDRELDVLRKKIPEVIVKLDALVTENETLPALTNVEKFVNVKEKLDTSLSENRQLRGFLMEKNYEIKSLTSRVSDAEEKMSKMNCDIQDLHIKASVYEEVNKCLLMEIKDQVTLIAQESDIEYSMMQEIYEVIFREAAEEAELLSKCEMDDSEIEFYIMQELCGTIFREALKDAEEKISNLNMKYSDENKIRVSLEMEALENQKAIFSEIGENQRLMQESFLLAKKVEEKEKLMLEAATTLEEENKRFELACKELNCLKDQVNRQQVLITETSKESDIMKGSLAEAFEQLQLYKVELCKTDQNLELAKKELQEADKEKRMLIISTLEKQNNLLLAQAKEMEYMKQMDSLISLVDVILKDFESRVAEKIERHNSRFENVNFHLCSLTEQASVFRRMGLLYKQKFERRCSDLQKAEAEVDLLGDEVDVLLNLLEKIYIALDHYSPVLKHYPGIIEILKLTKRKLSGESTRSAS